MPCSAAAPAPDRVSSTSRPLAPGVRRARRPRAATADDAPLIDRLQVELRVQLQRRVQLRQALGPQRAQGGGGAEVGQAGARRGEGGGLPGLTHHLGASTCAVPHLSEKPCKPGGGEE